MDDRRAGNRRDERRPWAPSARGLTIEWYLRMVMRYGVGGGGFLWELLIDRGRNPLVLLLATMIGTSTDVFGIVRGLIRQARLEQRSLEDLIKDERNREEGPR